MDIILSDRLKQITDEKFNNELQYQLNQFLADSDSYNIHCYQSEFLPLTITILFLTNESIIISDEEIKKGNDKYL